MRRLALAIAILSPCGLYAQDGITADRMPSILHKGRVLDAAGDPIADALITAARHDKIDVFDALERPLARSDKNGYFALQLPRLGGPTGAVHTLLIAKKGKAAIIQWRFADRTSVQDYGEMRLAEGSILRGRVQGHKGELLAGARVLAVDRLALARQRVSAFASQTFTDKKGVFELPCVLDSGLEVMVVAEGYYARRIAPVDTKGKLGIQLKKGGFIMGRVRNSDGSPYRGSILLSTEFHAMPFMTEWHGNQTDEQGRFRMSLRYPCRWWISLDNYGNSGTSLSRCYEGPRSDMLLTLPDEKKGSIFVQAKAADTGKAVKVFRAAISPFLVNDPSQVGLLNELASLTAPHSNRDGLVCFDGSRSRLGPNNIILVKAEGYSLCWLRNVTPGAAGPRNLVARLETGREAIGRVFDLRTKSGIKGVNVRFRHVLANPSSYTVPWTSLKTGKDGRFRFVDLGKGRYELQARHMAGSILSTTEFRVGEDEKSRELSIGLASGVTVSGRITHAEKIGKDWRLLLEPTDRKLRNRSPIPRQSPASSDVVDAIPVGTDGNFRFPHRAPGKEVLYLIVPAPLRQGPAFKLRIAEFVVAGSDIKREIALAKKLPGRIAGKVEIPGFDREASRFAVVATKAAFNHDEAMMWAADRERLRHLCLLNADGSYEITVPPVPHILSVVDIITDATLHSSELPIKCISNKLVRRDIKLEIGKVLLQIEPTKGSRVILDRLLILPPTAVGSMSSAWRSAPLHGSTPSVAVLTLHEGQRERSFFVKPGKFRLEFHHGIIPDSDGNFFVLGKDNGPAAKAEGEVQPRQTKRIKIKVKPPPLVDGARKK